MDRLRELGSGLLITAGALIGAVVLGTLGSITEHGAFGIITFGAAAAGLVGGIYVAQLILAGGSEVDE